MTVKKNIALGTMTMVAVSLAMWLVYPATGQPTNQVTVCVGSDSVLRSPDSGKCPPGSQQINLSGPSIETLDAGSGGDDPLGAQNKPDDSKPDSLADIERRLSKLEKASVFEVVDSQDRVIFSVAPGRVQLYNQDGTVVAGMGASSDGGAFAAQTSDGKLKTFVRAVGDRLEFRINEGDFTRADLGKQEAGTYSLKLPLGANAIAGIGESKAGTGAIIIGDGAGRTRAAMEVNDGKGALDVFNAGGNGVASLTESVGGGGLLVLTDANSNARVMMKSNYNRYGVVMTFPSGFPYVPKSGLPGSYMLGCDPGPACAP